MSVFRIQAKFVLARLQVFQKDGLNYFTDMMPALHNYVTVDTQGFLSNQHYVLAMYEMCKVVSHLRSWAGTLLSLSLSVGSLIQPKDPHNPKEGGRDASAVFSKDTPPFQSS